MIHFPTPLPDELLYSVFARYHDNSGNESSRKTLRDLFLSSKMAAITGYSGHLYTLHTLIPGKAIPVSYLLEHHTLIPYYRPFISEYRFDQILHNLVHTNCKSIYMWMGLPPSGVKMPQFLRYCNQCVPTDRLNFGLAYWHRVHQMAGVSVCPEHQCYLLESLILYAQKEKKHMFISLEVILPAIIPAALQGMDMEINLAQKAVDLLNSNYDPLNLNVIREQYFYKLQNLGFLTAGGNIKFRELVPRFNSFYGTTVLEEFGCVLDKRSQDTWLHKMLRKPRHSTHPLRHLLVQYFLDVDLKDINANNQNHNAKAFGQGPWPCLNKASTHFEEKVIKSVRVTRCSSTAKPVGTFQCSCGFVYSRRGPDIVEMDMYRIGRIKQFGAEWMRKLNELSLNSELSLREKARKLGVDPGTVKKYLRNSKSVEMVYHPSTEYRRRKPKRQRKRFNDSAHRRGYKRVDWEKRDVQLAEAIERTANYLKSKQSRRISRSEITRQLHCSTMIHTKREKLPLSRAKLELVVETTKQHHERIRMSSKIKRTAEDVV